MPLGTLSISNATTSSLKVTFNKDASYKAVQLLKTDDAAASDFNWDKEPGIAQGYNLATLTSYPVTSFIDFFNSTLQSTLNTIKAAYPSWHSDSNDVVAFRIYKWVCENVGYDSDHDAFGHITGNWKFVYETLTPTTPMDPSRGVGLYGDCEDTANLCTSLIYAALMDEHRDAPLTQDNVNDMVRSVVGYVDWDGDHLWDDGHAWTIFKDSGGNWKLFETTFIMNPGGGVIPYADISEVPNMIDMIDQYSPLFDFRAVFIGETTYGGIYAIDTTYDPSNNFGIWGEFKDTNEFVLADSVLYNGTIAFDIGNIIYPQWNCFFDDMVGSNYKYSLVSKRFSTLQSIGTIEGYNGISWVTVSSGIVEKNVVSGYVILTASYQTIRVTATFNSVGTFLIDNGSSYSFTDTNLNSGTAYYYRHIGYTVNPPRSGSIVYYYGSDVVGDPNYHLPNISASTLSTDTQAPANVANFVATAGDSRNTLSWINPPDVDFVGVMIRFWDDGVHTYPINVTDGTLLVNKLGNPSESDSYVHSPLTNGVTYYYSIFSYDGVPNYSSGVSNDATPQHSIDTTPPHDVINLYEVAGDQYVDLSWQAYDPPDTDLAGYKVYISTTGSGIDYVFLPPQLDSHTLSRRITSLINDTQYFFKVTAIDTSFNESSGVIISSTPKSATGAPEEPQTILRNPTNDETPTYYFDFIDTPDDNLTAYEIELSDMSDFSHIVYRNLYTFPAMSAISNISAISGIQEWQGFPPGPIGSGLSATWYSANIPMSLTEGSYFLRLRTRDSHARYSSYGVSQFVLDTSVTGVQIIIMQGEIVNNKNITLELRAPSDVVQYIVAEEDGYGTLFINPDYGMVSYQPFVPDGPVVSTTFDVNITGSGFVPENIVINKGDTVRWTNNSNTNVMVVSGVISNNQKHPDGLFNSSDILPGYTYEFTFAHNGNVNYYNDLNINQTGTVEVLNYTLAKHLPWVLSSGPGNKTIYAQFKDELGNESAVINAFVVLAIPRLISPQSNEVVKTTLPILEWSVPRSLNNHNVHFKLQLSLNLDMSNPLISVETSKVPYEFKYQYDENSIWIPFPVSGVESNKGQVKYVLKNDLLPNTRYYWRVTTGA